MIFFFKFRRWVLKRVNLGSLWKLLPLFSEPLRLITEDKGCAPPLPPPPPSFSFQLVTPVFCVCSYVVSSSVIWSSFQSYFLHLLCIHITVVCLFVCLFPMWVEFAKVYPKLGSLLKLSSHEWSLMKFILKLVEFAEVCPMWVEFAEVYVYCARFRNYRKPEQLNSWPA